MRLGSNKLDPELLLKLADPTAGQPRLKGELEPAGALPAAAPAALALAKQARLLPAALVAPSRKEAGEIARPARDFLGGRGGCAGVLAGAARSISSASPRRGFRWKRHPRARIIAFRVRETGAEHLAILIGRPEERGDPAGAGAFPVLHRRSARQLALRLRGAVAGRHRADRRGGCRRAALSCAGRARDRAHEQASGLSAAGRRIGHGGCQQALGWG